MAPQIQALSLANRTGELLGLEKELELERRKLRETQDAAREKDKEYQKLRVGAIFKVSYTSPQTSLDALR